MYLMYYLNEKGERMYTLKVSSEVKNTRALSINFAVNSTEKGTEHFAHTNSASSSILARRQIFPTQIDHQEAIWTPSDQPKGTRLLNLRLK